MSSFENSRLKTILIVLAVILGVALVFIYPMTVVYAIDNAMEAIKSFIHDLPWFDTHTSDSFWGSRKFRYPYSRTWNILLFIIIVPIVIVVMIFDKEKEEDRKDDHAFMLIDTNEIGPYIYWIIFLIIVTVICFITGFNPFEWLDKTTKPAL